MVKSSLPAQPDLQMKLLVVGAGMMARAVCYDLVRQPDVVKVTACDTDRRQLERLKSAVRSRKLRVAVADAGDSPAMRRLMEPCDAAVSCVPYFHNLGLARAAVATGTHFCDLGGNNTVVDRQFALDRAAVKAGVTVVPDCGLAPGLVSILAADGVARLDKTEAIHIRVGGLPRHPRPPLNYGLVFSPNGLINEYIEPCLVLRRGRVAIVPPLEDIEGIRFPSPFGLLEAFNTSGGSSRLPLTYRGVVKTLDYKTIRYPGHCAQVRLLKDLGLTGLEPVKVDGENVVPRRLLIQRLEAVLPWETDDVVLLQVEAKGMRDGRKQVIRYEVVDYADKKSGLTSMMRMTGFPAAVMALMAGRGQTKRPGVLAGEDAVEPGRYIAELCRRGISIRRSATHPA